MRNPKILMIGPFPPPPMGPAVRNEIIRNEFVRKGITVYVADTTGNKSLLILKILISIFRKRFLYLSVSKNGQIFFVNFLSLLKKFVQTQPVLFYPAGGKLYENISEMRESKKRSFIKKLNTIENLFVQTDGMNKKLKKIYSNNVNTIPNPKPYRINAPKYFSDNSSVKERKIVFFSRIREKKGVKLLIDAAETIKNSHNIDITLHFYGLVTNEYELEFHNMINSKPYIKYFGVLPHDKTIVETLNQYYVMVFPTLFDTEGFPGVLADAALSGVPVVASDISYNSEIVTDQETGLLFEAGNVKDLGEKIFLLLHNVKMRNKMAERTFRESEKYLINNCIEPMIRIITEKRD